MPGDAVYGLWLNQKGKVAADSFVIRAGVEEFRLVSYESPAALLSERLESFIIADDVSVEDETVAWSGVTLFTDTPMPVVRAALSAGFVFAGRRGAETHCEWIAPHEQVKAAVAQLNADERLTAAEMETRRITARIPSVPRDIGPEDLPQEGELERDAVSFNKGCYLGQEVMARLHAMGRVRRRLLFAKGTGDLPTLPAALYAGEKQVGELRTAVARGDGFVGLAMISLISAPADGRLSLAPDAAVSVTVEISA